MYVCMYGVVSLAVGVAVNPYKGKIEDDKVETMSTGMWQMRK